MSEQADKMHDSKMGGLSPAGRKHFKDKDGSNLKPGVTSYDSASTADKKRWISWASRFAGNPQPLTKDNGEPTNYALMFKAWGRPVPKTAADVKATYDLAMRRKKALGMGEKSASDQAAELEAAKAQPQDQKLYDKVVDEAKKKFDKYPSFYANMWVSNTYKKRGGKFKGSSDNKMPDFLKSAEDRVEGPTGMQVTDADKANLRKLKSAYTGAASTAMTMRDSAGHHVVAAIGASAHAFMHEQCDSIDHLLGDEETNAIEARGKAADWGSGRGWDQLREDSKPIGDGNRFFDSTGHPTISASTMPAGQLTVNNFPPAITTEREPARLNTDDGAADVPVAKAFVTRANGKTLITGPAATIADGWQKALSPNEHMLWIQGRLVGGETPNRNNALWTAGDLEMGQPTVAHGPLNWLHESRHVIGSIADSRFVPAKSSGTEQAATTVDPHIVAAAGIWNWLYPDEAMVTAQASELNQLWYSMECISKNVVCSGADGCGHTTDYFTFARDEPGTCEHMKQRSSTLRFAEPTFLGAAVIVPPTRPGWADADATVLAQAASLSEKAFEQAGQPDIPASTFEQMMAQVLKYADA